VAECDTCQRQKFETIVPLGLLQPLHVPIQKCSKTSMDFITGLPTYKGNDVICVIVDRLTKYVNFVRIYSKAKASQVVDGYVKNIFKLHGFPKVIVGDRDPKFTISFWKELFHELGTSLTMITSYHPQTNGQTEVLNKFLEGYLRNFVNDRQTQWIKWLHVVQYYVSYLNKNVPV
jgi:hypothetical protein